SRGVMTCCWRSLCSSLRNFASNWRLVLDRRETADVWIEVWVGFELDFRDPLDSIELIGKLVNPRNPKLVRQVRGPGSSLMLRNRLKIVSNAICPSIRANAAPKQK